MTLSNDDVKSWGVSLGVHGLLFLFMLFLAAFPNVTKLPKEIEITFIRPQEQLLSPVQTVREPVPVQSPEISSPTPRRTEPTVSRPAAKSASATSQARTVTKRPETAPSQNILVPPAQPRTKDPVEFTDFGSGKAENNTGRTQGQTTRSDARESTLPGSSSQRESTTKTEQSSGRITSDNVELSGTPSSSANIVWSSGVSRNRIAGSLPTFPKDVHREAQIKVKFTVRPDGTIFGLTLMQKGEPRFEDAALAAMRGWKFNALPPSVAQTDQDGVVTFFFRLK